MAVRDDSRIQRLKRPRELAPLEILPPPLLRLTDVEMNMIVGVIEGNIDIDIRDTLADMRDREGVPMELPTGFHRTDNGDIDINLGNYLQAFFDEGLSPENVAEMAQDITDGGDQVTPNFHDVCQELNVGDQEDRPFVLQQVVSQIKNRTLAYLSTHEKAEDINIIDRQRARGR